MWKIVLLTVVQCVFFALAQIFLKLALNAAGKFGFTWTYVRRLLFDPWFISSGACALIGTVMWMYILKRIDFSIAYPLSCIAYLVGMIAAVYVFHETVPPVRWIGFALIMGGLVLITR
jgi:undecaprenyl phosphate-alpha-L-ara4N flippase subunit ArnE